nr:disease resistance RPP13-like protein 4 [Quercus suber]
MKLKVPGSITPQNVQVLPKLHKSEEFKVSSFYKEIKEIFEGLDANKNKFLSCFAVLTEHAVVKRTLLTYWGLGQSILSESHSTPEKIVDEILGEFKDKGLIDPATKKRKYEVTSYKRILLELRTGYGILVKGNEKSSKKSPSQEKLVALFNLNDPSPDVKLNSLAKDVDWLSKMKTIKVLYLGRWQKSAGYHIEVKSTEFLKELTTMEELRFLSLQGISRINKLPRSIGMLKNLVVLDLKDCNNLEELPEEISKLKKLSYPQSQNSKSGFIIGDPQRKNLGALEDLKGLKKLKKLTIIATRKDFPTPEDLAAFLELKALRKLTIAWGVQPKKSEEQAKAGELSKHETSPLGKAAASSVRLSDKLPNKLEKLDLQCFPYSTPTWLKPGDLPMLEKLYVRGGNFATLEKDTWKVKALRLKYLSGMKTIWRELKELFPDLVYLERVKCPGITLCPCDENGVWQNPKT